MKKQLIALSVLAGLCGAAYAQTNVTIYGFLDTGIQKETGKDVSMAGYHSSRIGFRGTEDLGSGYKAHFQLEKRYNVNSGKMSGVEWEGASNVGLSGPFGLFRVGRVNDLETESFSRIDPMGHDGVAASLVSSQHFYRLSNTLRYDSPTFAGFSVKASYSLGENMDKDSRTSAADSIKAAGADNDGYALSIDYNNGPVLLLANFSRHADSNNSYIWSIGGAYKFDCGLKVSLGYQRTDDRGWNPDATGTAFSNKMQGVHSKQDSYILSGEYVTGPHKFTAMFNYMKIKDIKRDDTAEDDSAFLENYDSGDAQRYSLGYEYHLSKRTYLYGHVAYTNFEDDEVAKFYRGASYTSDNLTGVAVGINHSF